MKSARPPMPPMSSFHRIQEISMGTRFTTITATVFFAVVIAFCQAVAAEDEVDAGFLDAMVEFLTIQNAAYEIEGQMTYAVAQKALEAIAASGVEVTQPMQDVVLDVARSSVGTRFGNVDFLAKLYAPLYAEHYSESELRELTTFWKSPVGQKTLDVMPKLTEGSFLVLQEASVEFMPSFEVAVDQGLIEAGIFSPPQP